MKNSHQIQPVPARETQTGGSTIPTDNGMGEPDAVRILRLQQVVATVGLGRSSIYAKIQNGSFPPPIKLGGARASGWLSTEVNGWIADQIRRCRGS
jgi:prophage regulatory protein